MFKSKAGEKTLLIQFNAYALLFLTLGYRSYILVKLDILLV
jgi:hypothetical protein